MTKIAQMSLFVNAPIKYCAKNAMHKMSLIKFRVKKSTKYTSYNYSKKSFESLYFRLQRKPENPADEDESSSDIKIITQNEIRKFVLPKLNCRAKSFYKLVDMNSSGISQPPVIQSSLIMIYSEY